METILYVLSVGRLCIGDVVTDVQLSFAIVKLFSRLVLVGMQLVVYIRLYISDVMCLLSTLQEIPTFAIILIKK